jgi:hypothetical protein
MFAVLLTAKHHCFSSISAMTRVAIRQLDFDVLRDRQACNNYSRT